MNMVRGEQIQQTRKNENQRIVLELLIMKIARKQNNQRKCLEETGAVREWSFRELGQEVNETWNQAQEAIWPSASGQALRSSQLQQLVAVQMDAVEYARGRSHLLQAPLLRSSRSARGAYTD